MNDKSDNIANTTNIDRPPNRKERLAIKSLKYRAKRRAQRKVNREIKRNVTK